MPRGKLNYESFEEGGELVEMCDDPHGHGHIKVTPLYDDDDSDEGCDACGNPAYPDCKSSCPLYDD